MPKYDVFLSHNSADKPAVEELARRLTDEAGLNPFLDKWHLVPGEPWQEALEEALNESATVAVFVGPSGVSPWHNEEMRAALDSAVRTRDEYRAIPVLLPGATEETVTGFLARRTWVDFRPGLDDAEAFERLVAGIKGEAVVGGSYTLPDEPTPYRGLLRFEEEQARFFFGREADGQTLVEKLDHNVFMAVVGASGSGKSSLIRAGLIPQLRQDILPDSRNWHILVFTPGSQPLRALSDQLATLVPLADRLKLADDLTDRLRQRADGLRTALTMLLADNPRPILLVIDQFEELFTLCREEPDDCRTQAEQFVANLADMVNQGDGRIRILITLRADFLDRCLAIAALRDLLQDRQLLLGALSESSLREAIVRPAQEVGAFLEKGLVNTILRDVTTEPGILPLLQHALYELWRARRGPWLTLDAYEKSGGVTGALQRRAQATYESLTEEQQRLARNIFLRLTALGEGVSDTRRRISRTELYPTNVDPAQVDAVLQVLSGEKARLVVVDEESVEVTHEALIQEWATLRTWLETNRTALRIHRNLTEAAEAWAENNADPSYLYRGVRLAEVEEWLATNEAALTPTEESFITASQEEQEREQQEQLEQERRRQQIKRQRWIAVGLTVGLLIVAGLATFAFVQRSQAITAQAEIEALRQDIEKQNNSRQLASAALDQMNTNHELATLLAIEAGRVAETFEADTALRTALAHPGRTVAILSGHTDEVRYVAWSPDDTRLVTTSQDGTARIWEAETGIELATLSGHAGWISKAIWSPDGRYIVTISQAGANLWDAIDGIHLTAIPGIYDVAWNSTGSRIAIVGDDHIVQILDAERQVPIALLSGHTDWITQVAWSPRDDYLLTASKDGTVRVWDGEVGTERISLPGHNSDWPGYQGPQAIWSPDGQRIVTTRNNDTVRVWDARSGDLLFELPEAEEAIWDTTGTRLTTFDRYGYKMSTWDSRTGELLSTFDNDSRTGRSIRSVKSFKELYNDEIRVLTSTPDGLILWNAETGTQLAVLSGHTQGVSDVAWDHSGARLATVSGDGTGRIWDIAELTITTKPLVSGSFTKESFFWNQQKDRALISDPGGMLHLWDVDKDLSLATLGPELNLASTSWSLDGKRIVTLQDQKGQIWDTQTGLQQGILPGNPFEAVWNSSGTRLVTTNDQGVQIWEAASGAKLADLEGCCIIGWNENRTRVAIANHDGTVSLWDIERENHLSDLADYSVDLMGFGRINWGLDNRHLAWSPDNTRLVIIGEDGQASIWDVDNGTQQVDLGAGFSQVEWNETVNRLVTQRNSGEAGLIEVWDLETGQPIAQLSGQSIGPWNQQHTRLVTTSYSASDGTVWVWNAATGSQVAVLSGHTTWLGHIVWNSDGTRLITTSQDRTARVWDVNSGVQLTVLTGHTAPVSSAAWSPDETRIATASEDFTARVWDAATGRSLAILPGHTERVKHVAWSADGQRILTADGNGLVRIHDMQMTDLLEAACQAAPRNLSRKEWNQYFPNQPYQDVCPGKIVPRQKFLN